MNKHKEKCDKLKKVRKNIADKIGVDLHQKECTFSGNCKGTCPKCKQEEDILNAALLKKAGVAVFAAGAAVSLTACGIGGSGVPEDTMGIAGQEIIESSTPGEVDEPLTGGITIEIDDSSESIEENEPLMGDIEFVDEETEDEYESIGEYDETQTTVESKESESINEDMLEPLMGVAPYVPEDNE